MTPTQILIREEILRRLAAGESLRAICRDEGFPSETTVRTWARDEAEFGLQYARARALGYERLSEEILAIADNTEEGETVVVETGEDGAIVEKVTRKDMTEHRKMKIDARKWMLSKMLPKVYGDKLAVEASGPNGGPLVTEVKVSIDPAQASQTYQDIVSGNGT